MTLTLHGDTAQPFPRRKGGGFYGYKIHMAVDAATDLPLARTVETAKDSESRFALLLPDEVVE